MRLSECLKALEPIRLATHNDSDGVYSAAIVASVFNVKSVEFPEFHKYKEYDAALDLGQPEEAWNGVLVDHHPILEEYYKPELFFHGNVPTGVLLYNHLKDLIPQEKSWYVIGSAVGDGQPEAVPKEIWKQYPILLDERGIIYKYKGESKTTEVPMFYYLSSGCNAFCRLGVPHRAFEIIMESRDPLDFIEHPEVEYYSKLVREEEEAIYKSRFIVETYGRIVYVRIATSQEHYKFASLIASKLQTSNSYNTYVVVNEKNGEISIRGFLSDLVVDYLNRHGIKCGGHLAYAGGKIPPEELNTLTRLMRRIRYEIFH
jgi:single-stranded DNA-specific DHH superfamily exonuclease